VGNADPALWIRRYLVSQVRRPAPVAGFGSAALAHRKSDERP
jgi:hypothetical protein